MNFRRHIKRTEDEACIFLHLPKCGGTTLHRILEKNYSSKELYTLGMRGDVKTSIERFRALPKSKQESLRCLKGHMPFGLHECLPLSASYITLLRDPIERVISHYYDVRSRQHHYLHEPLVSNDMTLYDYVSSDITPEIDNGQTRLLSGIDSQDTVYGSAPCGEETLRHAIDNLEQYFSIFGIVERFDEFLILASQYYGWDRLCYIRRNTRHTRRETSDVTANVLAAIRKKNHLDIRLYEWVRNGFERRISVFGKDFDRQLRNFTLRNRIYQLTYGVLFRTIKHTLGGHAQ